MPAERRPGIFVVTDHGRVEIGMSVSTQVAIVGAGPAGLTLAFLLEREGIDCVVLEARSREYVERRVRAGLLEQNTVDVLRDLGLADRLDREGLPHPGVYLRRRGRQHHVDMTRLTGRQITIYGQQEIVKDLVAARLERGGALHFEVSGVAVHDLESDRPRVTWDGGELACDLIAGCDGFHGICRPAIREHLPEHEFVRHSMRSPRVSRLYLQVPAGEDIAAWADDRIWAELATRLGHVNEGPILEKGITPMRSFVTEPMQHGRLVLAGDAAHFVQPTGAKGLNLAVNDVRLLAAALADHFNNGSSDRLHAYSETALRRVW